MRRRPQGKGKGRRLVQVPEGLHSNFQFPLEAQLNRNGPAPPPLALDLDRVAAVPVRRLQIPRHGRHARFGRVAAETPTSESVCPCSPVGYCQLPPPPLTKHLLGFSSRTSVWTPAG